jgi:hypothetical protein
MASSRIASAISIWLPDRPGRVSVSDSARPSSYRRSPVTSGVIVSCRVAGVDMVELAIDIAIELARLGKFTNFELRGEWRRLHRMQPPMRSSRDLLMRGITYKLQERALGGLSKSMLRKLETCEIESAAGDRRKVTQPISLRPGTRLVREWHSVTHTVLFHADGLERRGTRYRSLTVVARKITGVHWSLSDERPK